MKRILLFATISVLSFAGCKKALNKVEDYYPKVTTVSATVLPDGSVQVVGQIDSEGDTPIQYTGFAMDTLPSVNINQSQVTTDMTGNSFTAIYSDLSSTAHYYFRAWAANTNGYSQGNVISVDNIKAQPVVAPCTPTLNTVNIGGGQPTENIYNVDPPTYQGGYYTLSASSNSVSMTLNFGNMPTTRVYTTTTNSTPSGNYVNLGFYSGFLSGVLSDGSLVYVNQKTASSWEITICNAPWTYNSSTFNLTTRFVSPK